MKQILASLLLFHKYVLSPLKLLVLLMHSDLYNPTLILTRILCQFNKVVRVIKAENCCVVETLRMVRCRGILGN